MLLLRGHCKLRTWISVTSFKSLDGKMFLLLCVVPLVRLGVPLLSPDAFSEGKKPSFRAGIVIIASAEAVVEVKAAAASLTVRSIARSRIPPATKIRAMFTTLLSLGSIAHGDRTFGSSLATATLSTPILFVH